MEKKTSFCRVSKSLRGLLYAGLCLVALSATGLENEVMMQYFHWYLPADGTLWTQFESNASDLVAAGITAVWLPPAYKGAAGSSDVGYGVYDLYDLGEFNQKGSVRTKYGTRDQYLSAISTAHSNGLKVYADVVFNHKGGADATEWVDAIRCESGDRNSEYGGVTNIQAWTLFDFPGRGTTYSTFQWHWYHFDGVDWADNLSENSIFRFVSTGKTWDWEVDTENGNYDYLLHSDIDFGHAEVVNELKAWGLWYQAETNVDGFRLDAIKHIPFNFFSGWLDHLRNTTGEELFTVGEMWNYDVNDLHNYIAKSNGSMSLFDAPLHLNFFNASNNSGGYDMRYILNNSLMKENPDKAVTLVENHDTQPCQSLASPVQDWFKPLAYAIILLRSEGLPNIFFADYYGASYNDCGNITMASHKNIIDILLAARRDYAYGAQLDYFDHGDIIGWTRKGDATHSEALAVILSDGPGGSKWMDTGKPDTAFNDLTGHVSGSVTTDSNGWGNFSVNGGSVSVWASGGAAGNTVCFQCFQGYTIMGENVYVVGSTPELGNWNTNLAIKLDPNNYPTWDGTIGLPAGSFEWKCIKKNGSNVVWQPGQNNSYSGGPGCTTGTF